MASKPDAYKLSMRSCFMPCSMVTCAVYGAALLLERTASCTAAHLTCTTGTPTHTSQRLHMPRLTSIPSTYHAATRQL